MVNYTLKSTISYSYSVNPAYKSKVWGKIIEEYGQLDPKKLELYQEIYENK